jgi:hypothetical protein
MASQSKPISYSASLNNLLTSDGQLTPTGIRAMQLFNTYTDAGVGCEDTFNRPPRLHIIDDVALRKATRVDNA